MEAVVLAGGFGTRLAHIVPDVPKPMAPVCEHPFLEYILSDLSIKGVTSVVLAVGYKAECIENYFKDKFGKMELIYSLENEPLGTGGAVKKALRYCTEENVFIVNGDTFFDVNLEKMKTFHNQNGAEMTVATKQMKKFSRYGTIIHDTDNKIVSFVEKQPCELGEINGGLYLIKKNVFDSTKKEKFSFEQDYMEAKVRDGNFYSFLSDGYFIDIGVPEDYKKAQEDFCGK